MTVDAVAVPSGCETKVRMSSTKTFVLDSIVDPDAYLEDRSLLESSGGVDLAVVKQMWRLHGVVEIGVGGLGVGSSRSALIQ
jgi:hypothetical protein